ncbi:peptidase M48, Ste24p [Sphingorhabdus arenilitoris]|uniref:Peptidase M48, Ste24p n=1 Tax=Sphingorhabdus arenilitoris TaxID=1490041 RepID=A0ABV8RH19_9SPHN
MVRFLFLFLVLLLPAAAGAVPQQPDIDAYRALVALDKRIITTGYRLAGANAPFCKNRQHNPGWALHSYRQYPDRDTARAAFAFPMPVAIAALVDGGPADKAGLREGDSFTDLPGGIWWGGELIKHEPSFELTDMIGTRLAELLDGGEAVNLPIKTAADNRERTVALRPPAICASTFIISSDGKDDAGADGQYVRISAALAEYTPDPEEFAAIVAHELAHNILEHRKRLDGMKVKRGIGRMFGKSKKAILQTEVEADQLSVWLMVNAGYDPSAAVRFWQRRGPEKGLGLLSDGTHPGWRDRVKMLEAEIKLIEALDRRSLPYQPPLLAKM